MYENPPPVNSALLLDMHARSMKIVESLLQNSKLVSSVSTMLRQLIFISIRIPISGSIVPKKSNIVKKVETDHPYKDNTDVTELVSMPGVSYIEITFDNRSKTEKDSDYISFFKDSSKTSQWGETRYHGGKDGTTRNFPGTDGRSPLKILADKFYYRWYSDSSSNDWGYIMTITGVMSDGAASKIAISTLEQRMNIINKLLYSAPAIPKIHELGISEKPKVDDISNVDIIGKTFDIKGNFTIDGDTPYWQSITVLEKQNFSAPINKTLYNVKFDDGSEKWVVLNSGNCRRRISNLLEAIDYFEEDASVVFVAPELVKESSVPKKKIPSFIPKFNNCYGITLSEESTVVAPSSSVGTAILNGGFLINAAGEDATVSWTMNIMKEESGNEMTCIGLSTESVPNSIKYEYIYMSYTYIYICHIYIYITAIYI